MDAGRRAGWPRRRRVGPRRRADQLRRRRDRRGGMLAARRPRRRTARRPRRRRACRRCPPWSRIAFERDPVEMLEERPELARAEALAHRRRTADVGEQQRERDLRAADLAVRVARGCSSRTAPGCRRTGGSRSGAGRPRPAPRTAPSRACTAAGWGCARGSAGSVEPGLLAGQDRPELRLGLDGHGPESTLRTDAGDAVAVRVPRLASSTEEASRACTTSPTAACPASGTPSTAPRTAASTPRSCSASRASPAAARSSTTSSRRPRPTRSSLSAGSSSWPPTTASTAIG